MTDLQITGLCAEAMGFKACIKPVLGGVWHAVISDKGVERPYSPLTDDAQCFALVKRFQLYIGGWTGNGTVTASIEGRMLTSSTDLNRAICECVAKMQAAK